MPRKHVAASSSTLSIKLRKLPHQPEAVLKVGSNTKKVGGRTTLSAVQGGSEEHHTWGYVGRPPVTRLIPFALGVC